jgi:hypothetical protein
MTISDSLREAQRLLMLTWTLLNLPKATLHFHAAIAPDKIRAVHDLFTRPHARCRLIKNKTLGIALIDLSKFNSAAEYTATVKKKDYAEHRARTARRRGYSVRPIDRNQFIDEIFHINTSAESRQGRQMDPQYRILQTSYDDSEPMRCFGVFHGDGRLMGYCSFGIYGNFGATDRLLGYKNKDGAMYLLLVEIISFLIDQRSVDYFMYDTFLGSQDGLQSFKRRIGFQPYRVRYSLQ